MQKFLLLFLKRGSFLVFIKLEIIAFNLIVKYNHSQKEIFLNSSNIVTGSMLKKYNGVASYVNLKEVNEELSKENARLTQKQINYFRKIEQDTSIVRDSVQYKLITAEISNKTLHLRNNYITINKGTNDGVERSMGVIANNGIVGIVRNASGRFAQVLSLLNEQIRISVLVKNKNYLGNLAWEGTDPTKMTISAIPKHSKITLGDTIITSGYSSIFPKGIEIGVIDKFWVDQSSGNNYTIIVDLFINMNSVAYCYVIDNELLKEQKSVEID